MKKVTFILIGTIYILSILLVSIFGMRSVVFDAKIFVSKIEVLNVSDNRTEVTEDGGVKIIKIKFKGAGIIDEAGNPQGTFVYLQWRVLPDDASNKKIELNYNTTLTKVEFVKGADGDELGLILFKGPLELDIDIKATDGSGISQKVVVWAYP